MHQKKKEKKLNFPFWGQSRFRKVESGRIVAEEMSRFEVWPDSFIFVIHPISSEWGTVFPSIRGMKESAGKTSRLNENKKRIDESAARISSTRMRTWNLGVQS